MPYTPPHTITPLILSQVAEICEQVGRLDSLFRAGEELGGAPAPHLRKNNRIRTIHSSLAIENNSLSLDQVTDVIAGKRVLGLEREVQEVRNAFAAYQNLEKWNPKSSDDLLAAHGCMMKEMMKEIDSAAGRFRSQGVGIYRGSQLVHMAPPADRVPYLIDQLFNWLDQTELHPLIASAVVHYELEFIHPFSDGNGRIGRLWQTLILTKWNPIFEELPVETIIHQEQTSYYKALGKADAIAEATPFIDFTLSAIITALRQHQVHQADQVTDQVNDQVKKLLLVLSPLQEASVEQLIAALKLKHRPTFRSNYLRPAIEQQLVTMTQPNAPNSPTQKYKLTAIGNRLLK